MVCLDTPYSRATSSAFRPASTCFSAVIICASVCLLFDILRPLQIRNHTQFCADPRGHVSVFQQSSAIKVVVQYARKLEGYIVIQISCVALGSAIQTAPGVHLKDRRRNGRAIATLNWATIAGLLVEQGRAAPSIPLIHLPMGLIEHPIYVGERVSRLITNLILQCCD